MAVNRAGLTESLLASSCLATSEGRLSGGGIIKDCSPPPMAGHCLTRRRHPRVQTNLRVLQSASYVWEKVPRKIDVRILAATHESLVAVSHGTFRLICCTASVSHVSPPLRQRRSDTLLVSAFLSQCRAVVANRYKM
jgi:hypothetical protein